MTNVPTASTGDTVVTVFASADPARGVGAHFKVMIDGQVIGEATADNASAQAYTFAADAAPDLAHKIQIQFDNDLYSQGQDRNLHVAAIAVNGRTVDPTASIVSFDRGALDGNDVMAGRSCLNWNGTLVVDAPDGWFTGSATAPDLPPPPPPPQAHGGLAGDGALNVWTHLVTTQPPAPPPSAMAVETADAGLSGFDGLVVFDPMQHDAA